ncbi:FAD-dependent oxidoreductase [Salipiger sp. 1_MG-2023]|uniref:NAD(P)/FAD-dependent oxidoreductase n=1 Tax=Salipiger sp. 1_MG-2023 TaxID=3062665 RepID=UPI0026E1D3C9|nr:FAD-dependent oxidoreductase [Salipiger sp. 1_MG-2023]MDO6587408.1 FAD-dependent oxidoreductase [Salipiger sp. 1_MG-2023]
MISDYLVVGGGIVGAAIAEGLARVGEDVVLLDEGDIALRAARGNFGNVWVQGKGAGAPPYANLTRQAAHDWADLADRLGSDTGIDLQFRQPGAAYICFSEEQLDTRAAMLARSNEGAAIQSRYERLDRAALAERLPDIGPSVAGGTYCPDDGTANPLHLLRALIASLQSHGGRYLPHHKVEKVDRDGTGFSAQTAAGTLRAGRIVLAAGLANAQIAPMLGLRAPVRPVRGQILVTERLAPFLGCGTNFIRQTVEGSCLFGESSEEVGNDDGTTLPVLTDTVKKAVAAFPVLANARVVRSWGALRIMTPDGVPVYHSRDGAFAVSVHSGVTLCPFHTDGLITHIQAGSFDGPEFSSFQPERFDVQNN